MYQLFNQYKVKEVGIVQVGASEYHMQYHYPNGGSNYVVYVFNKKLTDRGRLFSTDEAALEWIGAQPTQLNLPFGEQVPRPAL
jgi:hypothetical protein